MSKNRVDQKVDELERFIEQKEEFKNTHPLRYLFWEATLQCNLTCRHCGSDCTKDNTTKIAEIDGELVKKELLEISKFYPPKKITFAIIGGEPLLRHDLFDVGSFAAKLGYYWGIVTNGMLLDKLAIKSLKDAGLKTISLSLDGMEKEHDALRNSPGSHKVVSAAIENLIEEGFYKTFDVICCVNQLNIDRLNEFLDSLIQKNVPAVRFVPIFSHGRASESKLMLTKDGLAKLLHFVADRRREQKKIRVTLGEEGYFGPRWEGVVRDSFHYCGSGVLIGTILHNGDVTGCPSVSRSFIEGNIKKTSFLDMWQKGFVRFRKGREKLFAQRCAGCEHWILCEGGGFHLLDQKNMDNHCQLEKMEGS